MSFDNNDDAGQPSGDVLRPRGLTITLRIAINLVTPLGALTIKPSRTLASISDAFAFLKFPVCLITKVSSCWMCSFCNCVMSSESEGVVFNSCAVLWVPSCEI